MFERFTNTARRAIVLSQHEARQLRHDSIKPRHILLGMMTAESATAAEVLSALGVQPEAARTHVVTTYGRGDVEPSGHIPFSVSAKKALEHSLREALALQHNHIGTLHLLLALVTGPQDDVAAVLDLLGVDTDAVRQATMDRLSAGDQPTEP